MSDLWGKKVICHLHGFYSKRHTAFRYDILRHYSQYIMNRVDSLILLSESFAPEFDRVFPRTRKAVVPNFVSRNISKSDSALNRSSESETNILYMGRLSHLKGTYDLLKAASLLKADKRIHFLLAGLGETKDDEKRIISQIHRDGLNDKVKLLGYVEGQRKSDLFRAAHIFVLPSYTEIFPVVIVEAMAAALPVVATPVGAVPDIVQDGLNGFVVSVGDYKTLAKRIRYLVQHPQERLEMGRTNLQKFQREYRTEINIDRIDRIYKALQSSQ